MKTPTPTDERPICPICDLRVSDEDFYYDGCDIIMHRHCDKEISKTPTPDVSAAALAKAEEVKDRVAVKHGWFNWNQAMRSGKRKDFLLLENEAMQEYALAFHKAELEKLITKTNKI